MNHTFYNSDILSHLWYGINSTVLNVDYIEVLK